MFNIEGEKEWGSSFDFPSGLVPNGWSFQGSHNRGVSESLQNHFDMDDVDGSDGSSWTLGTDPDQTSASPAADTPTLQSDAEEMENEFGG